MRLYPPENSKYSSPDAFDETENELISTINVDKRYIALTGDFNSKTGTLTFSIQSCRSCYATCNVAGTTTPDREWYS